MNVHSSHICLIDSLNHAQKFPSISFIKTCILSEQGDTRPKCRLLATGGVNVNWRTSSTPHSVALPAAKRQYLGSERGYDQ